MPWQLAVGTTIELVHVYSKLYTYKASESKHAIIRLHCATLSLYCGTWNMYPVAVPLNVHTSIVQVYISTHCTQCLLYLYSVVKNILPHDVLLTETGNQIQQAAEKTEIRLLRLATKSNRLQRKQRYVTMHA